MTHVITEPCIGVNDQSCLAVCPVECIHEDETHLYIDPDDCIDCGACVTECPVEAIFTDQTIPDEWREYIARNARLAAERRAGI